jgi:hypothetical protein
MTQKPADRLSDEIVAISLRTLPDMLVAADGPFCLELTKDNRTAAFDRDKSWRYTVMCLLGLARAQAAGLESRVNVKLIFDRMVALMPELGAGEIGLLVWLAVRINSDKTAAIAQELFRRLEASTFESYTGMKIAWIMTGVSVFSGAKDNDRVISRFLDYFFQERVAPSGLIYHLGHGARRRFPNFATQIYSLHALSICGRYRKDPRCIEQATRLAGILSGHQRENGGWPWLYDAKTGGVVEPFEIYSVHQHGMAPMAFFEYSDTVGKSVAEIISKSMAWLTGQNELGFQMIAPENGLIYRSIRRRSPYHRLEIYWRVMESLLGWKPGAIFAQKASRLEVNYTCRPYELGWLLEAWTGRGPL